MQLNKRRTFLKYSFLSSTVIVMSGCDIFSVATLKDTIKVFQSDIFPKAKELKIDTSDYISVILHHKRVSKEDKEFLKNGVKWLNEESVKMYKKTYTKLLPLHRQNVIKSIVKTQWGDSWTFTMMTYTFEAMFGDPIYGSNNKEAGWKWLQFTSGQPRPKKAYL